MIDHDFLNELHCPYCDSYLTPEWQTPLGEGGIRYGILKCECCRYPIVDGIIVLRQSEERVDKVIDHLKAGNTKAALLCAFNLTSNSTARRSHWQKLVNYGRQLNLPLSGSFAKLAQRRMDRKIISNSSLTLLQALKYLKPAHYAQYLFHRYANPSFWAATIAILLLQELVNEKETNSPFLKKDDGQSNDAATRPIKTGMANAKTSVPCKRVLDLACGIGHSSFLIRHLFPQLFVVAADYDFVNLYLAKRFVADEASFVCLDAEVPLPFADHFFDAVFCLDALHYIRSKMALIKELDRTLQREGFWFFPHLHNALADNFAAGMPLRPEKYRQCFDFLDSKLFIESDILQRFVVEQGIDIGTEPSEKALREANAYWLIGSRRNRLWHKHSDLTAMLSRKRTHLRPNPIYRITEHQKKIVLEMAWPSARMTEECGAAANYMPAKYEIDKSLWDRLNNNTTIAEDTAAIQEMVRSFVLVQLPLGYAQHNSGVNL